MNTKAIVAIAVVGVLIAGGAITAIALMGGDDDKLPSKYDQRDKGIVTPVKYQNPWGTCWSFGSTGAAETSILTLLGTTVSGYKETYGEDIDFSEKHLAWFALNPVTNAETDTQVGEGYQLKNSTDYHDIFNNGGRAVMAASLYSTGVGPVIESGYDGLFGYWGDGKVTAYQWFNGTNEAQGLANTLAYLDRQVQVAGGWDDFRDFIVGSGTLDDYINARKAQGYVFPQDYDATTAKSDPDAALIVFENATRTYMLGALSEKNYYTDMTDWSLPDTDIEGDSLRNLTTGYTMLNGNIIPFPNHVKEGKWDGLNKAAIDVLKKELYAGHGVAMSFFYDSEDGSFNETTWSQFCNNDERLRISNHAIQVVGWDDSYSKDNFKNSPEENGAWLCKNSWGSETEYTTDSDNKPIGKNAWGITNADGKHTGYFWISYCDRSLRNIMSYEFTKDILGDKDSFNAYVYDFLPTTEEKTLNSNKELKTANVFTVEEAEEILKAVSVKTSLYGSDTNVSVYKLRSGFTSPVDGELLFETTKDLGCEGFHVVMMDKEIKLKAGDKVSVVVTEKNEIKGETVYLADYNYGIDAAHTESTAKTAICAYTVVNEGESFYYKFDESSGQFKWYDWRNTYLDPDNTDKGYMVDNFRIKMFTVDATA